ncbi:MAG TPA: C40 family peptidase [Micromonosporaceae bacterium]
MLRILVLAGAAIALIAPATAAQADPSASEIQQQINKASAQLETIVEQYNKTNEQLKASKAASQALGAKMAPLEHQVAQAQSGVAQIAATAYKKEGQASTVSALLAGGTPEGFLSRLSTLDQLARSRQQTVAGFTAARQQYDAQKQKLDSVLATQAAQARQLAARKAKIQKDLDKLYEMRRQAYGSATTSRSSYSGSIPAVSGKAGVAIRYAYGAIGTPYVWAADGPDGYDCSGLTLAAWRAAGVDLPHNAAMQWDVVAHIGRSQLQPGDLVFYEGLGHVAIYVGSGNVIHAPTFGEVVKISDVDIMTPYGYGRVRT